MSRALVVTIGAWLIFGPVARAQSTAGAITPTAVSPSPSPPNPNRFATGALSTWVPPIASALVPGSGQFLLGQDRGAIYLITEAFLLTRYFALRSEARREEDGYRNLAFTVARKTFGPTTRDTVFEYFEQMEKFRESGPFDTNPGDALTPPMDERTFNGSIWALARRTFFTNPDSTPSSDSEEFLRALQFYRSRAVGPNFAWSWRNAGLERDLFTQSIRESDAAFRTATRHLGLLLANHLLSVLDAFVSQRLSRNGRPVYIGSVLARAKRGQRLSGSLQVRIGF